MTIIFDFFIKTGWTERCSVIIFYALFVFSALSGENVQNVCVAGNDRMAEKASKKEDSAGGSTIDELEVVKNEFSLLRRQLSDVLLNSEKLNEKLLRYDLGVVSAMEGNTPKDEAGELKELLQSYKTVCGTAEKLKSKVVDLNSFSEGLMEKEKLEELDKVRLKCKLEEIVSETEKLNAAVKGSFDAGIPENCRILAVNDTLQIVVLDAGYEQEIRCGLVCRTENGLHDRTVLKIIAVRPFISAAIAIEGDIGKLLPGMNVKIGIVN